MKIKLKNSLLFRLFWIVAIPQFFLFFILGYIFTINLSSVVLNLKDSSFKSDLEGRASYVTEYLHRYRDYLDNLSNSFELSYLQASAFIDQQKIPKNLSIKYLAYIDADGEVFSKNTNVFSKELIKTLGSKDLSKFMSTPIKLDEEVISIMFKELRKGGYFAVALDISAFQNIIDKLSNIDAGVIGWVADGSGNLVASLIKKQVLALNILHGDDNGEYTGMNEAAENFYKNPKAGTAKIFHNKYGFVEHLYFAPINDTNTWVMGLLVVDLAFKAEVIKLTIGVAVALILLLTISMLLTLLTLRKSLEPIKNMLGIFKSLTNTIGEADLTHRLDVKRQDEIGLLSRSFNDFLQVLTDLIETIRGKYLSLNSSIESTEKSIMIMTDGFTEQINQTNTVSVIMEQFYNSVREVAVHSQNAAKSAQQGKGFTEAGVDKVKKVVEAIRAQATVIDNTAQNISGLQESSNQIGEVMEVINAIAEQTNLLALNAAIEAARAGEAGRGFAVVADEVRALAARTHESTQQISSTVDELRNRIDDSVKIMVATNEGSNSTVNLVEEAGIALADIAESISTIERLNTDIASATEEQSQSANGLSENLTKIVSLSKNSEKMTEEIKFSSMGVGQIASELEEILYRFKT